METAVYGVDLQTRALASCGGGGDDVHRFLVGTSSMKGGNKLHLLEYRDESRIVDCAAVWAHDEEVLAIASAPAGGAAAAKFATIHATAKRPGRRTCSFFSLGDVGLASEMLPHASLAMDVRAFYWQPQSTASAPSAALSDGGVAFVQLGEAAAGSLGAEVVASAVALGDGKEVSSGCWDPHHCNTFIAAAGEGLYQLDTRQKGATAISARAHAGPVRAVEHNPNRMYHVASAGNDGFLRFWDLRKASEPTKTAAGCRTASHRAHDHAVCSVAYNSFHDQLLMTGSADNTARLWHLPSAAKAGGNAAGLKEGAVKTVSDCGDSAYSCVWSASGPWVYAVCSYAGKVIVDTVPKDVTMGILLGGSEE
jgi:WD40 repeat protein